MRDDKGNNKVRILHLLGSLDTGGVETWLLHILRHIDRAAFQLDLLCLSGQKGDRADEAEALGAIVHVYQLDKNLIAFNRFLQDLQMRYEYHVVHSHVHHFSGYMLRQCYSLKIPVRIAHSHTSPPPEKLPWSRRLYLWQMKRWIARYATAGLGVSAEAMQALYGDTWRNDSRWRISYCGIDLEPFALDNRSLAKIRESHRIPGDAKIIGHVGRFSAAKNHQFWLQVAEVVASQSEEVWFLLVGDGALRSQCEEMVRRHQIPRVIFAGPQPYIVDFLQAMDLFLFPSLWEGLPLSVLEAQAAGLRCLCSTNVPSEVAIVPNAVELKALNEGPESWATACLSLLAKPPMDPTHALESVSCSEFSIHNNIAFLSRLWKEIPSG